METELISKITNEKKDQALVFSQDVYSTFLWYKVKEKKEKQVPHKVEQRTRENTNAQRDMT